MLQAQKREGKTPTTLRKEGFIPAVVYGRKEASLPIAVSRAAFEKVLEQAGESTMVALEGLGERKDVLIYDISRDAVSGAPLHADFYAVEKGQTVTVSIPLEFEGTAPAVKDFGGILVKVLHELEVEAEPANLPHAIVVSVDSLSTLESQIHVSDLALPKGVVANAEPDDVVAMISVAKEEVEETPIDISEIEVEKTGKKEGDGEGEPAPELK